MLCRYRAVVGSKPGGFGLTHCEDAGAEHPSTELTPPFSYSAGSSRNVDFRQVGNPVRALLPCLDATTPAPALRPALVRLRRLGL